MLSIVLSTLTALPVAPQEPQPKTTTRMLPLQQLCTPSYSFGSPPWGTLMTTQSGGRRPNLVMREDRDTAISAEGVQSALYPFLAPAIDEELVYLQPIGDNLLAFGQQDVVQAIERRLGEGAAILARPVQVEFAVWNTDRLPPGTTLTAEDYADFAAGREPNWRAVGTARPGQPIALEHMTWTRYVRGIEVEVAQKIDVSRPATSRFGEGGHVGVRAYSLIGSDEFALHLQFAVADQRGGLITLKTGKQGAADIELPLLESYFGTCSGRVGNGGALAITMRGNPAAGGNVVLTLRAHSDAPKGSLSGGRAALLPIGALTTSALDHVTNIPRVDRDPDDTDLTDFDERPVFGQLPRDQLTEMVESVLGNAEDDYTLHLGGGYLFVHASADAIGGVRALLQQLQDDMIRNVEIEHRASTVGDGSQPMLHELRVPTLLGREANAFRLFETNVVSDVYVEVAQEAGSLEPRVRLMQSGTWLRSRVVPAGQGLHLDLDVQCTVAPMPQMRSVMPDGGVLMQARVASARVDYQGTVQVGRTLPHGDGPDLPGGNDRRRTVLTTTLRR
ncbi:MAG: hypothetical protein ACE37K_04465 [Planctomycetota bacterium]